jgi:N-acetylneuraminic acid mutarotase
MACGGCGKKQQNRISRNTDGSVDVFGGYGKLNNNQIKARLEVYKRKYCVNCEKRYKCDYEMYVKCKKGE